MRTLIGGVCCLVCLALVFNIIVSTQMALVYEEEADLTSSEDEHSSHQSPLAAPTVAAGEIGGGGGEDSVDAGGGEDPPPAADDAFIDGNGNDKSSSDDGEDDADAAAAEEAATLYPPPADADAKDGDSSGYEDLPATAGATIDSGVVGSDWFHGLKEGHGDADRKPPLPPPLIPNASSAFADRWCDLTNVKVWWPADDGDVGGGAADEGSGGNASSLLTGSTSDNNGWQLRAPAIMIPGAKHGGTAELAALLHQHPAVFRHHLRSPSASAEVSFFYNRNFATRYVHPLTEKTKVGPARDRLYAVSAWGQVKVLRQQQPSPDNRQRGVVAVDSTPSYLFYSSLLPRRILCVLPWVRLVVVLRQPVDRVVAQYQHARRYQNLRLSLDDWLDRDLKLLQKVGLVGDNATAASGGAKPLSQQEQDVAWYEYLSGTVDGAVGRSLYEIQLRQWFQALRAVGRNPSDSVYVVFAEDLVAQPQAQMERILRFIHLDNIPFTGTSDILKPLRQPSSGGAATETRASLDKLFHPYNKRLVQLLRTYQVKTSS